MQFLQTFAGILQHSYRPRRFAEIESHPKFMEIEFHLRFIEIKSQPWVAVTESHPKYAEIESLPRKTNRHRI